VKNIAKVCVIASVKLKLTIEEYFLLGQHLNLPQAGHLIRAEFPGIVNGAIMSIIHLNLINLLNVLFVVAVLREYF
jgi:hypothetical protein